MKSLFVCAALAALSACNSQEHTEAQAAEVVAAQPLKPSMPAPDEEAFAAAYAEACTRPKVSTSLCKSQGFGKDGFTCEYGLGDDQYRRHKATLVPNDGKWVLAEPETICAADAA